MLGLGAGDEDGWSDAEGEAVELLGAGDVLDGLVANAACDGFVVSGELIGGEGACGVGEQGGLRDVEGVEKEKFGIAAGVVAEV
jgi:hypothetical protein